MACSHIPAGASWWPDLEGHDKVAFLLSLNLGSQDQVAQGIYQLSSKLSSHNLGLKGGAQKLTVEWQLSYTDKVQLL